MQLGTPRVPRKRDCPYATTRTVNPNKRKPRSTLNHHRTICELFLITQTLVSSKTRTATPKPNSSFGHVRTHCKKSRCMNRSLEMNKWNWTWRQISNTFELVWQPIVNELDESMLVIPQEKAWNVRKNRRKKGECLWRHLKLEVGQFRFWDRHHLLQVSTTSAKRFELATTFRTSGTQSALKDWTTNTS